MGIATSCKGDESCEKILYLVTNNFSRVRLVEAGASLSHTDMAGQCPLVHAAKQGRSAIVEYLLACDWDEQNARSKHPEFTVNAKEAAQQAFVAAASQGHEAVLEYLLDTSSVDINAPDSLIGETALTVAAANGSTATVSILASRGANLSAVNGKSCSPLMLAAREGHWGTADKLLQGRANLLFIYLFIF